MEFYATATVRALSGYLAAVSDPAGLTGSAWAEFANTPNRYLTNAFVEALREQPKGLAWIEATPPDAPQRERLTHLTSNILEMHRLRGEGRLIQPREVLQELDRRFGISESLGQIRNNSTQTQSADSRLLFEMVLEQAADHSTLGDFVRFLAEKRDSEENSPPAQGEPPRDRVEVMTIHKAKGREWEHVALFHPCLRTPSELPAGVTRDEWAEEERRVFYVGATRCQARLLLTFGNDCPFASEFLLNPKLEGRKRHELLASIGPLKRRLEQLRQREHAFREECGEVSTRRASDIAKWRTEEETARSEANSLQFDAETSRRQLRDLEPLRTSFWRYLSQIGLYSRQERELRRRIGAMEAKGRALRESAEHLAKQQAQAKSEVDRLMGELKRIEDERAGVEDAVDEIGSEVCFRETLGTTT